MPSRIYSGRGESFRIGTRRDGISFLETKRKEQNSGYDES